MQFVCGPLSITLYSPELDALKDTLNRGLYAIDVRLDALQASFDLFKKEFASNMAAIDDAMKTLTAEVAANNTVESSAVTLIQGLAAQIQAAAGNPAAVTALASQLKTSSDALAAAITANTPASATTA